MGKNLVPEVCKLLGVEVGEEFKVKDVSSDYTTTGHYLIDKYGRVNICDDNGGCVCAKTAMSIDDFLTGKVYEVVKLPWKPKDGEKIWSFYFLPNGFLMAAARLWNSDSIEHLALYQAGWVYKTQEEAKAALPSVAEKLGMKYDKQED